MSSLFYQLGRFAGPRLRRGQWLWQCLTGTEEERVAAETAAGRDVAVALRRGVGIVDDPELVARVVDLGSQLAAAAASPHRSFEFAVLNDDKPNAFALPGGFIFLTSGLGALLADETEALGFILGHEISHVTEEHAVERMITNLTVGAAVRRLSTAGVTGPWLKSAGAQLLQSAHSRENELDADRLGARLAVKLGLNPVAALSALEQLLASRQRDPGALGVYFSSHPPFDVRLAALRKQLNQQPKDHV